MGDSSPEVLPTSQDPPRWNPSQLSDVCAPRKDPNSERLARDKPEMSPMTIKPETVRHVSEQFSPFPSPSCPPPRQPFPIKPLTWTALLSPDNSFPSVRQEPTLKPWKGYPFLHQNHNPGENIFKMLSCRKGNGTPSSIMASEIPGTEELGGLQSHSRAFLRGGNSPRKVEAPAKSPRAFHSTDGTVAEDSQLPGLLIPASFTRYMCGKLESKICPSDSVVKNPPQCWRRRCDPWDGKIPRAVEPVCHNCGACALEPGSHNAELTYCNS